MKKLLTLFAMILMIFMSSIAPGKEKLTDGFQQKIPTIEGLNKKIKHAWNRLQKSMTVDSLNKQTFFNSSDFLPNSPLDESALFNRLENLLQAQYTIFEYQRALGNKYVFQKYVIGYYNDVSQNNFWDSSAIKAEISNDDFSNPIALKLDSILFSASWRKILQEWVGASYKDVSMTPEYLALYDVYEMVTHGGRTSSAACEKVFSDVNVLELSTAIGDVQLKDDELAVFNDFKTKLSERYEAAVTSYKASDCPDTNVEDPNELQDIMATAQIDTFFILKQSCFYGYLHLLVTKRDYLNNPNEAVAFKSLQQKLEQLLANVDVRNPVALLQAQMDMINYENAVCEDVAK
ncbi:MAG: hypothetical protein ACOYK6_03875 [Chthoniobacterales bacterium]